MRPGDLPNFTQLAGGDGGTWSRGVCLPSPHPSPLLSSNWPRTGAKSANLRSGHPSRGLKNLICVEPGALLLRRPRSVFWSSKLLGNSAHSTAWWVRHPPQAVSKCLLLLGFSPFCVDSDLPAAVSLNHTPLVTQSVFFFLLLHYLWVRPSNTPGLQPDLSRWSSRPAHPARGHQPGVRGALGCASSGWGPEFVILCSFT